MSNSLSARRPTYVASNKNPLASLAKGELWRAVTPIFIHLDWLHIVFNMIMFFQFGALIESLKGTVRLGGLILVIAVISNVAQAVGPEAWGGHHAFGGMSGVVYGLFGYVWVKSTFCPEPGFSTSQGTVIILIGWLFLCMTPAIGPSREHRACRGPGDGHGGGVRALVLETMSRRAADLVLAHRTQVLRSNIRESRHPLGRSLEESLQVADKFDPYREALVVETATVWPADCAHVEHDRRPSWKKSCMPIRRPALSWNISASTPASVAESP